MTKKAIPTLVIGLLVFIAIAALMSKGALSRLDTSLAASAQSLESAQRTAFFKTMSGIGEWYVYIPFALLLLIIPRTRVKFGVPSAVALAISAGLNYVLKNLFRVPRPDVHRLIPETGYAFPSAHAMIGTAFIGMIAALILHYRFNRGVKTLVFLLALIFLLAVGFSRVYLGVHHPSDIVAGYAGGIVIDAFIMLFVRDRRPRHLAQRNI